MDPEYKVFVTDHNGKVSTVFARPEETVRAVLDRVYEAQLPDRDAFVFIEDEEEPVDTDLTLAQVGLKHRGHAYCSRCRRVSATVRYNGRCAEHEFPASAKVRRVEDWAEQHFQIAPADRAELVFRRCGTDVEVNGDVRLGTLAEQCEVCFDLGPKQRVQGYVQSQPTPDELVLRDHLSRDYFDSEVGRKWSSARLDWPFVHIAVFARQIDGMPDRFWFRFDCTNYPVDMPTARPWDAYCDEPLAHSKWPVGDAIVTGVFRPTDWRDDALYLPCDRIAVATHHASWVNTGPAYLRWTLDSDITLYLNEIHALINSPGYTGTCSA